MSKTTKTTATAVTTAGTSPALRWTIVLLFAVLAFFATYRYAIARGSSSSLPSQAASAAVAATGSTGSATGAAGGAGCCGTSAGGSGTAGQATGGGGCCGGSSAPAGAQATKTAKVAGNTQKITVDTSKGYYDPSAIELKAGVPAEITFTQSSGCLAQVQSSDLNFSEDLTGGPKTIKLPALKAGTYQFSCGMQMQFGSIVVK